MNKIYLVIEHYGWGDDYVASPIKAFKNLSKATEYVTELKDENRIREVQSEKCQKCSNPTEECPFYLPSTFTDAECENYNPWFETISYEIEEINFEE